MNSPAPTPAKASIGTLRALWPFVRKHRGLFIAWLAALACSSTATLSLPVAFRQMIDLGFSSGANIDRTFGFVLVVIVVLAALEGWLWRIDQSIYDSTLSAFMRPPSSDV